MPGRPRRHGEHQILKIAAARKRELRLIRQQCAPIPFGGDASHLSVVDLFDASVPVARTRDQGVSFDVVKEIRPSISLTEATREVTLRIRWMTLSWVWVSPKISARL